jgi:Protein of unknown function (DUF1419)
MKMTNYVIIEEGSKWPWTISKSYDAACTVVSTLLADGRKSTVIEFDRWQAEHEAEYLNTPVAEITEERWYEMLEVLPPLGWTRDSQGVELFCMSEFTDGRITTQFAHIQTSSNDPMGTTDRYFEKSVRFGDKSTYITRDNIPA